MKVKVLGPFFSKGPALREAERRAKKGWIVHVERFRVFGIKVRVVIALKPEIEPTS